MVADKESRAPHGPKEMDGKRKSGKQPDEARRNSPLPGGFRFPASPLPHLEERTTSEGPQGTGLPKNLVPSKTLRDVLRDKVQEVLDALKPARSSKELFDQYAFFDGWEKLFEGLDKGCEDHRHGGGDPDPDKYLRCLIEKGEGGIPLEYQAQHDKDRQTRANALAHDSTTYTKAIGPEYSTIVGAVVDLVCAFQSFEATGKENAQTLESEALVAQGTLLRSAGGKALCRNLDLFFEYEVKVASAVMTAQQAAGTNLGTLMIAFGTFFEALGQYWAAAAMSKAAQIQSDAQAHSAFWTDMEEALAKPPAS